MRYLKTYKLFESNDNTNKTQMFFMDKINFDLIDTLKDISMDYLDEGGKLSYIIYLTDIRGGATFREMAGKDYIILMGTYHTKDDKINWDDMGPVETEILKRQLEKMPKDYIHWTNLKDEHYNKVVAQWEKCKSLSYGIALHHQGEYGSMGKRDIKGQMDIVSRIKSMFPNENIISIK